MSHLGGHMGITHVDEGALLWLRDKQGVKSLLDIGCGPGGQVVKARELGMVAWGVDGDPELATYENWTAHPEWFKRHDFYMGSRYAPLWGGTPADYDAIWCVEFLEHIEEFYVRDVMDLIRVSIPDLIVMTHALPGQEKPLHPNCRTPDYWDGVFASIAYRRDEQLTSELKAASTMEREFIQQTGKVYVPY